MELSIRNYCCCIIKLYSKNTILRKDAFGRNGIFNIQVCGYARNFSNGEFSPLTAPIDARSNFRDSVLGRA
jgi:hypothetical protein